MIKASRFFTLLLDIVCTAFFAAAIIFLVFSLITYSMQNVPKLFGTSFVYVVTDSMQPGFNKGDVVIIKEAVPEELEIGDIIAFYKKSDTQSLSDIYFHRIVDKKADVNSELLFQTKGDANTLTDAAWVGADRIVGVYSENRGLQAFLTFALSLKGVICLIILPAGIMFMIELLIFINHLYSEKDKRKKIIVLPAPAEEVPPDNIPPQPANAPAAAAPPKNIPPQHANVPINAVPPAAGAPQGSTAGNNYDISALFDPDLLNGKKVIILPSETRRRKKELSDVLSDAEDLKSKPKVTGRMVMKIAVALEKFKNSTQYRSDAESQAQIREALNWCYGKLSKIQYKYENKNEGGTEEPM